VIRPHFTVTFRPALLSADAPKIDQFNLDSLHMASTFTTTPRTVYCDVMCTVGSLNVGLDVDKWYDQTVRYTQF
jgi:hypothetical protein